MYRTQQLGLGSSSGQIRSRKPLTGWGVRRTCTYTLWSHPSRLNQEATNNRIMAHTSRWKEIDFCFLFWWCRPVRKKRFCLRDPQTWKILTAKKQTETTANKTRLHKQTNLLHFLLSLFWFLFYSQVREWQQQKKSPVADPSWRGFAWFWFHFLWGDISRHEFDFISARLLGRHSPEVFNKSVEFGEEGVGG